MDTKNNTPQGQTLIGKLLDDFSALPVLWGLNEPGALVRHGDVFRIIVDAGKAFAAAPTPTQQPAGEALADVPRYKLMSGDTREWMVAAHDGHWYKVGDVRAALATQSGAEVPSKLRAGIESIADELEAEAVNYEGDFADTVNGCAEALRVPLAQHSTKEVPSIDTPEFRALVEARVAARDYWQDGEHMDAQAKWAAIINYLARQSPTASRDDVLEEVAEKIEAMNDSAGDRAAYENRDMLCCEEARMWALKDCADGVRALKGIASSEAGEEKGQQQ